MALIALFTTALITSSAAANLFSSGMFLVRISSEKPHHIQYCFTELPYSMRRRQNGRCLKSGHVEVAKRAEKVIDLSLVNVTTAYTTVEFIIQSGELGPTEYISERIVVDGAMPAKRVGVAAGLVMDFVTICDRPWYGLMCSRYCTEQNDAHYVCDPRGEKVCLAGWTGKDCDTATEDIFLAHFDDSTRAPPTATPATIKTTAIEFIGSTSDADTASATTTAPATSLVPKSTRRKLRVQKGMKTRTTLSQTASTPLPTSSTKQAHISTFYFEPKQVKDLYSSALLPVRQDPQSSTKGTALTLLLLLTAIVVIGYLLTLCARNTSMQNWINSRRAKISAWVTCAAAVQIQQHCDPVEPLPKIFAIAMEKTMTNVAYETSEELEPRYTSQPTTSADQSPTKSVASTDESNMYHEIDSFLVSPPLLEQRIATLV